MALGWCYGRRGLGLLNSTLDIVREVNKEKQILNSQRRQ
jgi:hypothetical protein